MYNEFDSERIVSDNGSNPQENNTNTSENVSMADAANQDGIYRMKFNNGESSEYTNQYNNYNGQAGYNSQGNYYHSNDYSYYQQAGPASTASRPSKKKKKGGTGRQLAKVVCFGLVFGLVAGGTMWGVNTLGNMASGKPNTAQTGSEGNFSLDVVKTSSQDVQTIEGTGEIGRAHV